MAPAPSSNRGACGVSLSALLYVAVAFGLGLSVGPMLQSVSVNTAQRAEHHHSLPAPIPHAVRSEVPHSARVPVAEQQPVQASVAPKLLADASVQKAAPATPKRETEFILNDPMGADPSGKKPSKPNLAIHTLGVDRRTLPGTCADMKPLKDAFYEVIMKEKDQIGWRSDSERLMPLLTRTYPLWDWRHVDRPPYIIDIGANVGQTALRLMETYSNTACYRAHPLVFQEEAKNRPPECDMTGTEIYSVEPHPFNFQTLNRVADGMRWPDLKWKSFQLGMAEKAGVMKLYGELNKTANQQPSLKGAAGGWSETYQEVQVQSVDGFIKEQIYQWDNICFLLKIDTEGYDAQVVVGAKEALLTKRVKWLVFEYNGKWLQDTPKVEDSLKWVTQHLYSMGYQCYLVTLTEMVPLWGKWWDDRYELWIWSNVMCGQTDDPDLRRVVGFYSSRLQTPDIDNIDAC